MVNYTIYQNWLNAYEQKIISQHELENINAFLQELEDRKTEIKLKEELKEMESQCPLSQMSKLMLEESIAIHKELHSIFKRSWHLDYSKEIKPEHKEIFIPIKSAEKLPLRSELYTREFKCLTYSDLLKKPDWSIQYLSGYYHEKSKRLFVQTIGDSYQIGYLQNSLLLQRCMIAMRKKQSREK